MCWRRWVWKCNTIHIFVNKIHILSNVFFLFFCLYPRDVCFMWSFFSSRSVSNANKPRQAKKQRKTSLSVCLHFPCITQENYNAQTVVLVATRSDGIVTNLICWIKQNTPKKTHTHKIANRHRQIRLKEMNGNCCECTHTQRYEWMNFSAHSNVARAIKSALIESSEYNYPYSLFFCVISVPSRSGWHERM